MELHNNASFQWANGTSPISVTPEYIVPQPQRPNNTLQSISIPIIDMNNDEEIVVHEIAKACEEFGVFMIINHGIPEELCNNVLDVIAQFFNLPQDVKAQYFSHRHMDDGKIARYYLSENYQQAKKVALWSEALYHTWHTFGTSFIQNLPENPSNYRDTIASYTKEMGTLMAQLLSIISQGLGLSKEYLQKRIEENPEYTSQANYYPPCLNPELTLGLGPHTDLKILSTILQEQGVTGLHIFKDEQWFAVDPIATSLVVNVADQLQVLSNEKYKSVLHRAVTNVKGRVSFATFCGFNKRSIIGPIQELVEHPPNHYYTRAKLGQTVVKQCFSITTPLTISSHPKSNFYFIKKKKFTKLSPITSSLPSMHILPKVYI